MIGNSKKYVIFNQIEHWVITLIIRFNIHTMKKSILTKYYRPVLPLDSAHLPFNSSAKSFPMARSFLCFSAHCLQIPLYKSEKNVPHGMYMHNTKSSSTACSYNHVLFFIISPQTKIRDNDRIRPIVTVHETMYG